MPLIGTDENGAWVRNEKGNEIRVAINVAKPYIPETWTMFSKLREPIFAESRRKELEGLFKRGAISIVDIQKAREHRLYHGRWVETVKSSGEARSRMVVCATNDFLDTLTYSPTVRRLSIRLGFSFASCYSNYIVKCRDITQAFLQSDTPLRRSVFLELPHELRKQNPGMILQVLRPLYGLPESPLNWYATHLSHYKRELGMSCAPHDPCMLLEGERPGRPCEGIVLLQVDDTATIGTTNFHE